MNVISERLEAVLRSAGSKLFIEFKKHLWVCGSLACRNTYTEGEIICVLSNGMSLQKFTNLFPTRVHVQVERGTLGIFTHLVKHDLTRFIICVATIFLLEA